MADKKKELYIGVKSDLSPFNVDLNALTRGLVVIGQSGCGKSFLVGRLIEEIIRKTTEKSRILIIDPNSDFYYGINQSSKDDFKKTLNKYETGLLKNEFKRFKNRELLIFNKCSNKPIFPKAQIFGINEDFDFSWRLIYEKSSIFLELIKGNEYSIAYYYAYYMLNSLIKSEYRNNVGNWVLAAEEMMQLKYGGFELKYLSGDSILQGYFEDRVKSIDPNCLMELSLDLNEESNSNIWRKESGDEYSLNLFAKSRVNIVNFESYPTKKIKLKIVAYILFFLLLWHKQKAIEGRDSQSSEANPQKTHENELTHTFILIDEAHNFAPEGTNDPHEKMLGELIHTVAAEGRKYGLHLILATQRPNKVKRGLLGECDNAIIMKMNSRSDLNHLAQEMRILDVKLLEPCLHFQGQGNALALGEMTGMAPYVQLFKSAPRRTLEGGVDILGF